MCGATDITMNCGKDKRGGGGREAFCGLLQACAYFFVNRFQYVFLTDL